MDQIQPWFRHSFCFSVPNLTLTLMPQVLTCLHFDPQQPCLRLLPWSLTLRLMYVMDSNCILILLGRKLFQTLSFHLLCAFSAHTEKFLAVTYLFHTVVVQSYAGVAFPEVTEISVPLEIPTWVKAMNSRETLGYRQCQPGYRSCHETGFVQKCCGGATQTRRTWMLSAVQMSAGQSNRGELLRPAGHSPNN